MGNTLRELRARKHPVARRAIRRNALEQTRASSPSSSNSGLTPEEKCELLELLRKGKSYKQAIVACGKRFGKSVSQRSLARWAAMVAKSPGRLPEEVLLNQYHNSGRGNSSEGAFTDLLVPFLDRNFRTRNGYRYKAQWVYWKLEIIRFCLLFAIVPPDAALTRKDFVNQIGESTEAFEERLSRVPRKHGSQDLFRFTRTKWYEERIDRRLTGKPEDEEIQCALKQLARAFPFEVPPMHGRLVFCERSILRALEKSGYKDDTRSNPHAAFLPFKWVKECRSATLVQDNSGEIPDGKF